MLKEGNVILSRRSGDELIKIENINYEMVHPPTLYGGKLQFLGHFEFVNNDLHFILEDDVCCYLDDDNASEYYRLIIHHMSLRDRLWYLMITESEKICWLKDQNKLLSLVFRFGVTCVFDDEIFGYRTLIRRDIDAMEKLIMLIEDRS